ncbi:MAG: translation initiation factor IF-6 [Thermococci archaeon]|nr:translation initiation factor IF-6 [Thermococci archaeon]
MHIERLDFEKSPYLGVYGVASDRVAFIREGVSRKKVETIEEVLKVPVVEISLMKSRIIGIFAAANSHAMVVPWYVWDRELELIRTKLKELGVDIEVEPFRSRLTALGNLILTNDRAALVSPRFTREEAARLGEILGVEVERGIIADYVSVGSVGVVTNRGGLVHPDTTDEELEWLSNLFGVDIYVGTANMGVPFVGSCMLANSKGAVVGMTTTGPEMVKIEEALGLI